MSSLPRTIREQVTDQLREEVVGGAFPPGRALRETELAERFGVSRGPVRDALLQLAQEGFLAYQANRGVTVRDPPRPEQRDFIVSLRVQVELFALRQGLARLTEDGLGRIARALDDLHAACRAGEVPAIARADMAFHQALLTACGGEDLVPVWKGLCARMLLTYSRLDDPMQIHAEHARILDGVRSGKLRAASTALKANIR